MIPATNEIALTTEDLPQPKRAWQAPVLTRHASLTVLTQHASLGTFSMLFQGVSGGNGGFGAMALRRHQ